MKESKDEFRNSGGKEAKSNFCLSHESKRGISLKEVEKSRKLKIVLK